jgi:glutathione S-transferase|tara:strand:+ start:1114 stop:1956 length:843 start_codon:yes stop_codon:yes gene_type:complete
MNKHSILLYGNNHSPWVQAIMMALHEKQLGYSRTTVPPLEVFSKWGPMMPAISIDGEPWFLESADILYRLGYSQVADEDMLAIRQAWTGVMHRTDYWPRFWGEFSLASDPNPNFARRFANNFLRAFTILYFFILIRFGVFSRGYGDPDNHADAYIHWEERLADSKCQFLGGDKPDSEDLLLFGIVQCHCSVPVPTVLALQADPRLPLVRDWIGRMQGRFSDYPSLFSGSYFSPHSAAPERASGLEQFAFWLGSIFWISLLPFTGAVIGYFIHRNRTLRGS